jgi:two-component system, NtrC family, response regulator HydG
MSDATRAKDPKRTTVLVVDDDRGSCEVLTEGLVLRGFDAIFRTTLESAIAYLRDGGPCDVVLSDLRLRGATGHDVAERARALRPHLPTVVITAFGTIEAAVEAIRLGAYDFITKPFELDTVSISVGRAASHYALQQEIERLRRGETRIGLETMIGQSPSMRRVYDMVSRIADSSSTVLITGESGTGKELVASALHQQSTRRNAPFVAVNCAAIPESLLESELFGHVKGAFTDASRERAGLFVRAGDGTLFLDEIADVPLAMQAKLLRALQERRVRPVGSDKEVAFEARIVAATHKDLESEVSAGRFRQDLYFRIHVLEVTLPPLRARGSDVLALAQHFLGRHGNAHRLSARAAEALLGYEWPGNVRELENTIERAVALARSEVIELDDLPDRVRARPEDVIISTDDPADLVSLDEVERRYILRVMQVVRGNKKLAAEILGLDRSTLYRKLDRWAQRDGARTTTSTGTGTDQPS